MRSDQTDDHRRLTISYALTLFILGVMVGLLAVVGRIAQEIQNMAIGGVRALPNASPTLSRMRSSLPPMIASLDDPGARLIALGFLTGVLGMVLGGMVWIRGVRPATDRERAWTKWGALITVLLLISMGGALVVRDPYARLVMLIAPSALALLAFVALVFGIAARAGSDR